MDVPDLAVRIELRNEKIGFGLEGVNYAYVDGKLGDFTVMFGNIVLKFKAYVNYFIG